jgi:YVTN family beta-propeller protein
MNSWNPLHSCFAALLVLAACDTQGVTPAATPPPAAHSSSMALSADGATLYVVDADADSVAVIDTRKRALLAEILLAGAPPAPDPATGAFTPAVMPRSLALAPDGETLYVSGQRSGQLYAIDVATRRVVGEVAVGSEPIGVLVGADGASVYVAVSQDAAVVRVDTARLEVRGRARVPATPWTLAFSPRDGALLATHLLGPGVSAIDPDTLAVRATWVVPDVAPRGDRRLAHGVVRGLYDLAARPGADELWVPDVLLAVDTAQPDLDAESTVFPSLSVLASDGTARATLSTDAAGVDGVDGAFTDVVAGPHALAFTRDGRYAIVVDTASEDLLLVDAARRVQAGLLRPLPGDLPEGIVLAPDESVAYVDERGSGDVAVVRLTRAADGQLALALDGPAIARRPHDPMPPAIRLGQHVFNSANSDELPVTTHFAVNCTQCHIEGRSDGVTWRFAVGPRDTPSNAGGMHGTGLLLRTAARDGNGSYFRTANEEQGGHMDPMVDAPLLEALVAYVDLGIPLPVPPTTDPAQVARGKAIFERADVGCATCHSGPRFTDSGTGNPGLSLDGPVLLHDVGTCVTDGAFPDVAHVDDEGHARAACRFDTPSLNGIASSPPYLHDGSAATIRDVLERTRGTMGDIDSLSEGELDDLVEYLRSL